MEGQTHLHHTQLLVDRGSTSVRVSIWETRDNVNHQKNAHSTKNSKTEQEVDRSGVPDDILLGGHAIASPWVVDWPTRDLDKDVVKNVMDYVTIHLKIVNRLLTLWQVLWLG